MVYNEFHFAQSVWLWGLTAIPVIAVLYGLFFRNTGSLSRLEGFIDVHLLPHLLINKNVDEHKIRKNIALWSLLWVLLMGALAGPRWDYKEVEVYTPDQSLVILLDLSQSMEVQDVKPSRLIRARQEIEDILKLSKGVKIGLIAFAADPHMITPLTDDMETIRHLLPSLDTDLVYVQGSNLAPALEMAKNLLNSEPGNNKSILVISDGGFRDVSATIGTAKELSKQGIMLHTMGVGTANGALVRDSRGAIIKQNGKAVISRLEQDKLQEIGNYTTANYSENDSMVVLNQLKSRVQAEQNKQQTTRHWEERFYMLILPLMLLMLLWFRKGFVFPAILFLLFIPIDQAQAAEISDFFKNQQQTAKEELYKGEYDKATEKFNDYYRKGVAQYKAGNFAEAERLFSESSRTEVRDEASYNLGNSLAKQQKFEESIKAYEELLKRNPYNEKAKQNLELVKKLLEQKKQQDKQDNDQKKDDKKQQSDGQKNKDKKDKKDNSGSKSDKNKQSENKPEQGDKSDKQEQKVDNSKQESQKEKQDGKDSKKTAEQEQQQGKEEKLAEPAPTQSNSASEQKQKSKPAKTQKDIDADQWLNRAKNDPKSFLKNQFYIESKRKHTKEGTEPW